MAKEVISKDLLESLKEEIKTALKFQRQVILYGPPGTGKTYLAKKVAEEFSKGNKLILLLRKYWSEFVQHLSGKDYEEEDKRYKLIFKKGSIKGINLGFSEGEETISRTIDELIEHITKNEKDKFDKFLIEEFKNWWKQKTGKEIEESFYKIVQFHPSYNYEDFVRGIQVQIKEGIPRYEAVNKIFAEICDLALKNPEANFVLIIDEINRANLPAVLGELIYALEYRGEPVETPYEVNGSKTLIVPENLYIIGTMNTADRSVSHIDYAIRRRFAFINVKSNKELIDTDLGKLLYEIFVEKIFKEENVFPDFEDVIEDIKIGHTYFLGKEEAEERKIELEELLINKISFQVIPLLREYIRDGILKKEQVDNIISEDFGKSLESLTLQDIAYKVKTLKKEETK